MRYLPPVAWDEVAGFGVQLRASIRSAGGNFAALEVSLAQVESRPEAHLPCPFLGFLVGLFCVLAVTLGFTSSAADSVLEILPRSSALSL